MEANATDQVEHDRNVFRMSSARKYNREISGRSEKGLLTFFCIYCLRILCEDYAKTSTRMQLGSNSVQFFSTNCFRSSINESINS